MIDAIKNFDYEMFHFINRSLSNGFFDFIMPLLRNRLFWIPLYLFIVIFCVNRYRKKGIVIILALLVSFAIADVVSARIIKPYVKRVRPCNELSLADQVIRRVPCGTGYSFPSAHACNHFAIACCLIGIFYRKWRFILPIGIVWAGSIAFAQVYVGVHYPIDVAAGAVLGSIIGLLVSLAFKKYQPDL